MIKPLSLNFMKSFRKKIQAVSYSSTRQNFKLEIRAYKSLCLICDGDCVTGVSVIVPVSCSCSSCGLWMGSSVGLAKDAIDSRSHSSDDTIICPGVIWEFKS